MDIVYEPDRGDDPVKYAPITQESLLSRLRTVEYTLVEVQKYLAAIIESIRPEVHNEYLPANAIPKPPLPTNGEEDEKQILNELFASTQERVATPRSDSVRGVFIGDAMRGPDGHLYSISHNYASKSHLVQGDILHLHIAEDGKYCYKQISQIERKRTSGVLEQDPTTAAYRAYCPEGRFRVLPASITYFKALAGDIVQCIIPAKGQCQWAAVEGIKKGLLTS